MVKYFCDLCLKELPEPPEYVHTISLANVRKRFNQIRISTGVDLCFSCLKDKLQKLEE